MATAETARLVAELTLKDKLSGGVKTATASIDKLDKRVGSVGRKIGRDLGKGTSAAARNIEHLAIAGGAALVGLGVASVKAAGDFEAGLNTINTVAQVTPERLQAIGASIRQLSRDTGTSVEDLSAAYYDLVSAGIKTADAQNVLVQANKLAIGGLSTTAEAVDLLTTAINSYGGDARKAAKFTNFFAETIAAGKTTAAELAGSFAQVGPLAAQFGVGLDQVAAALGVMTATGTPAAEAMTQIRAAIVALKKPNSELSGLQKKLGVNFEKIAKQKGLAAAYNRLGKEAAKAGIPMEKLTGRIDGALFAAQVAGPNFAKYNKELEKVRHSSDGAGIAQEQAQKRMQGFNFAMQKLGTNLNDAAITIGSALLPQLADLAGELTAFLTEHQDDIKAFGRDLASGLRDAAGWLKGLNWGAITSAFQAAAGFAKDLLNAFLGMPAWVQTAVITGWGLNKLTGGALGDILGELGKGLIKGVLGINAGTVIVKGGVVTGSGLPGAGAAGAAGAAGGIAPALAPMGLAAVAGTALAGFGFGELATAVSHGISDGLSDVLGLGQAGKDAGQRGRDMTFLGVFDKINDLPGTINRMGDAVDQLGQFINSPHPDFLGDLGKLATLQFDPKQQGLDVALPRAFEPAMASLNQELPRAFEPPIAALEDTTSRSAADTQAKIDAAKAATQGVDSTARTGLATTSRAVDRSASTISGAIAANRPIVTTTVNVNVTAASVEKSTTTATRYGPTGSSATSRNKDRQDG